MVAIPLVLLALTVAMTTTCANRNGPAGKSNIAHLYLYEKDSTTWQIVEGGAWGKMKYNLKGPTFDFVFNGHQLKPRQNYALINFARVGTEWPATIIVLGSGTADQYGNVHIMGSYDGALKYDTTPDTGSTEGYKIWLVLSSDIVDGKLSGWHPAEYLFESELINYDHTD